MVSLQSLECGEEGDRNRGRQGRDRRAENDRWVLMSVSKYMGCDCDAIVLQNKMGWATEVLGLIRQNCTVAC